ncbi:MAG: ABC transporter permease [Planctomycetota bacterium]
MLKYVFLVATREFGENAKTKGFWIGILIFPFMLLAGIKVPMLLDKQVPTRYFVLVDQSKAYEKAITEAIDAEYQKDVNFARMQWQQQAISAGEATVGKLEDAVSAAVGPEATKKVSEHFKDLMVKSLVAGASGGEIAVTTEIKGLDSEVQGKAYQAIAAWSTKAFEAGKDKIGKFEEPRRRFMAVAPPPDTKPELIKTAGDKPTIPPDGAAGDGKVVTNEGVESFRPYLTGSKKIDINGKPESLFALIYIPEDAAKLTPGTTYRNAEFWCINLTDSDLNKTIRTAMEKHARSDLFSKSGLDSTKVAQIQKTGFEFSGKNPNKAVGKEEVTSEDTIRQWAPVGAVYLLWVAIFTVAQMLLNNTTEEKQNRVIEVLLSSVTPTELMFGKLVGIAGVGLTMVGAWIISFVGILKSGVGGDSKMINALTEVMYTPELLIAFALYFLLGYLLYAGAFLAVGAVVNTLKEAQNMMGPLMLVMSVPLFTMVFIAKEPNGVLAQVLSWVPLYTPFVMMNRAAASPPLFDVIGTLILLVVSVIASIWISGKIFRIGVLRTGQPPKLMELLGWVRAKN